MRRHGFSAATKGFNVIKAAKLGLWLLTAIMLVTAKKHLRHGSDVYGCPILQHVVSFYL